MAAHSIFSLSLSYWLCSTPDFTSPQLTSLLEYPVSLSFASQSPNLQYHCSLLETINMPADLAHCQLDSYLRELTTTVVDCQPANTQQAAEGGDKKKKSREERKEAAVTQLYEVELSDTVLYPEGGGQPTDHGTIDSASITAVQKTATNRILHTSPVAFQHGQQVTVTVDWPRRFDHMQQHSAQHLISAQLLALANAATVSWWLASAPSECYIELNTAELTPQQLADVEAKCNDIIRSALPVRVHTFPSVAAALADESFTARLPAHKVLGEELHGTVRVIEIENVDMNPCGGTHIRCTSELQLVHLTRTDKVKGHVRVFFLAGDRALRALREGVAVGRGLAAALSCTGEAQVEMVSKLQTEARQLGKSNTKLLKELADLTAQQLVAHYRTSSPPPRLLTLHRDDTPFTFLQSVADGVSATLPEVVLFLTCTEGAEGKDGAWLLCGEGMSEYGGEVGKLMEGRGGGKGKKVQGKASRIDKRVDVIKWLGEKLAIADTKQ